MTLLSDNEHVQADKAAWI